MLVPEAIRKYDEEFSYASRLKILLSSPIVFVRSVIHRYLMCFSLAFA